MERIVNNISKMSKADDDANQDKLKEQRGVTKKIALMDRLMGSIITNADAEGQDVRDLNEEQLSEDYQMISELFDYNQVKNLELFGMKRLKHALYKGCLQGKKRHGLGVLVYRSGRVYEGEWQDEKRHGKGYE